MYVRVCVRVHLHIHALVRSRWQGQVVQGYDYVCANRE